MQNSDKLYVLIDKRLSRSQQAVQACHASIEFAIKYGEQWKHESLVLLAVDGGDELENWCKGFINSGYRVTCFREPYYNNRMTAVVCHGCDADIKDLRLL